MCKCDCNVKGYLHPLIHVPTNKTSISYLPFWGGFPVMLTFLWQASYILKYKKPYNIKSHVKPKTPQRQLVSFSFFTWSELWVWHSFSVSYASSYTELVMAVNYKLERIGIPYFQNEWHHHFQTNSIGYFLQNSNLIWKL